MNGTSDFTRKAVSATLAALILSLSVAVPILERGEVTGTVAVESSHDPGRCGHAHDHRVCAQLGANLSIVGTPHDMRVTHVTVRLPRPSDLRSVVRAAFLGGPPSRAPPLA